MTAAPNDARAHYDRGHDLAAAERFNDAIEEYRKADELWQKNQSKDRKLALCGWANALRLQEHYEQGVEKCREAIGVDPNYPEAHNGLGLVLARQEVFVQAIEEYRKADELWQKNQSKDRKLALCGWGHALRLQEHYEQAVEKFREAIGVDPDYPDAYNGLGLVLAAQELFDQANERYRKADELWQKNQSKDRKKVLFNWGSALRLQKCYEQAAEKYREAIRVDPEFAFAYNGLGAVLSDQELFDPAIEQYRKADELWQKSQSTNRKFALWNWGGALLHQEHFEDARAKYALAVEIVPKDALAAFNYGNSLAELGRYRDAIAQFDKASSLDQDSRIRATARGICCSGLAVTRKVGRNGGPRGIAIITS